MAHEITQMIGFSLIGCIYGLFLDEIFIAIQNQFVQKKLTKCIFAIIQLVVSIALLWCIHYFTLDRVNSTLSAITFTSLYYSTQNNLWNNLLAFKPENKNGHYYRVLT